MGRVVGSYRIQEQIGEGGMGTVYRGVDLMLEREVAVKVLRADLSHRPKVAQRFRAEAVTLARLNHPNVATLYSFLRDGDDFFMVMEFVRGRPLDKMIEQQGALAPKQAVAWFCQALHGIHHAHRLGIIHRDVKPANVMLTETGQVKVMDFGIARVLGEARMTRTGHLIGTLEYMSPEQIRSHEVDARSDIYALGILLYEMLTGQVPFAADSDFDLMRAQIEQTPRPPRALAPHLPESIERVVMKALEKDPAHRFQTADAFREALQAIRDLPDLPEAAAPAPAPPTRMAKAPVEEPTEAPPAEQAAEQPPADEPSAETKAFPKATRAASEAEAPTLPKPTRAAEPKAPLPATRLVEDQPPTPSTPSAPQVGLRRLGTKHYAALAAVLLLIVAGVWMLRDAGEATTPGLQDGTVVAEDIANGTGGGPDEEQGQPETTTPLADVTPSGSVTGRPSTWQPDAQPAQIDVDLAGLLTRARQYFDDNALTTPPQENAQDVCLEVLRFDPDNVEARGLLQQIAQRYATWGDDHMQRGQPDQAVGQYEKSLAVAARVPGGLAALTATLQQKLNEAQTQPANTITPGERQPEITPPPTAVSPGRLRIIVRPFGDIYVAGKRKARASNQVHTEEVAPGTYLVRAVHPSLGTWEKEVTVDTGRARDVLFNFNTEYRLTVTSQPVNAEIFVDGTSTGRFTPSAVRLRPGQHTIEIRKDGYTNERKRLTIERDGQAPLHFPLQRN